MFATRNATWSSSDHCVRQNARAFSSPREMTQPPAENSALRTAIRVHQTATGRWLNSMAEHSALFDRIGGAEGVERLVDAFYVRVLQDPDLAHFFEGVSMDKLRAMQSKLFSAALNGPELYTGRPINYAHDGLGITPWHLQIFLEHLFETVRELNLTQQEVLAIIERLNTYADQITHSASFSG